MFEDFYGTRNIVLVLREISDWIEENQPKNPVIAIIEQNSNYIHFRVYYDF